MGIFKHTGDGHYIGSCIILECNNMVQAKMEIREMLDENGLKNETLNIVEIDFNKSRLVYLNNGDY